MIDRAWVLLKSGRRLDLLDPDPYGWTDEDLATGLARTYRWGGHSRWELPLSVAQHSITVLRIRQMLSGHALTPAEQLRELAHDMDEGLLGFDAITPLKPHLGDGYADIVRKLQSAIKTRYGLQPWNRVSYAAHKIADRLAAASEAHHVVGWSAQDIVLSLDITLAPLDSDPVIPPPGMQPWEPWPPRLAARMFLELLHSLRRQDLGAAGEADVAVVEPGQPVTIVAVDSGDGAQSIEGEIVAGIRDEDGTWDVGERFTVRTEEGELFRVNGWCCHVEVVS